MALDDLAHGTRDRRGHWTPKDPLTNPPLFVFPPRPQALLTWLPECFLPWNVLFMASAAAFWFRLTPSLPHPRQAWIDAVAGGGAAGASAWDGFVATSVAEQVVAALGDRGHALIELPARPAFHA